MTDFADVFFRYFLYNFPLYFVWILGFGLSLIYMKKIKKASILTMIALVIFIFKTIILSILYASLIHSNELDEIDGYLNVIALVNALIDLVVWLFMLVAMFKWRNTQTESNVMKEPENKEESVDSKE